VEIIFNSLFKEEFKDVSLKVEYIAMELVASKAMESLEEKVIDDYYELSVT
jgi:hypothetical protein